jgi:hypothetical protein
MKIKWPVLLCSLFALSIVVIGTLSARIRAQEVVFQRLSRERENLQKLTVDNARLQSIRVDPVEMERLRHETSLLLKLRNEFGKLTQTNADPATPRALTRDNIERLLAEREELLNEEQQIRQLSARAACIKNLEQIALAKTRWAQDNAAEQGLPVVMDNLADYLPGHTVPVCPDGGHYSVNRIGAAPGCSIEGHSIP